MIATCSNRLSAILILALSFTASPVSADESSPKPSRLIVMADMGNEPDEVQQMLHLLMYANKVDIEGLIACSGKYLHADRTDGRTQTHPELLHQLVDGYAAVLPNLKQHEEGWPTPSHLRSIIKSGTADYGIAAVKPGRSNEASKLIAAAILKEDPRPLYIVGNAGTNTLAQALVDLAEARSAVEMDTLCERIIVFENGAQDNSGAWIAGRFPKIAWHRSNHQTYAYGGPNNTDGPYTWEPYDRSSIGQDEWANEHIRTNHGPLGDLYPSRIVHNKTHFIEGGGTIPWLGLINHGLADPQHLEWGGWSGRFSRQRNKNVYSRHRDIRDDEQAYDSFTMFEADATNETWTDPVHNETYTGRFVPVWRFRRAMFHDFRARMDWCVSDVANANHNPVAAVNGDRSNTIVHIDAHPQDTVTIDASQSSDPDGDPIKMSWWVYQEAGTYPDEITLNTIDETASVTIPPDAAGHQLHVILEVVDQNELVPLTDYRRVIINVTAR